jgi:hypothetical protein
MGGYICVFVICVECSDERPQAACEVRENEVPQKRAVQPALPEYSSTLS